MGKPFEVGINVPLAVTLDIREQTKTFSGEGEPGTHVLEGSMKSEGTRPEEAFTTNHEVQLQDADIEPEDLQLNMQSVFETFLQNAQKQFANETSSTREELTRIVSSKVMKAYTAGVVSTGALVLGTWVASSTKEYVQVGGVFAGLLGFAGVLFTPNYFIDGAKREVYKGVYDLQELQNKRSVINLIHNKGTITSVRDGEAIPQPVHGGAEM